MNDSDKNINIDKINKIVNYILSNTTYNIIFIPMLYTDKLSFEDYIKKYPNERIKCLEYDYDFRKVRRVIADSKICITMKHHPIIFAMGENIPVISLAFSKYYLHKNLGALEQYKQEAFSINLEDKNYYKEFVKLFSDINNNYNSIISTIKSQKEILTKRKEHFLQIVDKILL